MNIEKRIGFLYGLAAFIMWGVFPPFFKMLNHVEAVEILAHRILWSMFFAFWFLGFKGRLKNLVAILRKPRLTLSLLITGLLIGTNWGIYIYAVNANQILEASLGYFINPLMSMLLGALILKEKMNLRGRISIVIVFCAIGVLVWEVGGLPFISIILPTSFATYGVVKKLLRVPPLEGLFIETLSLFPVALLYTLFLRYEGRDHFGWQWDGLLLMLSGLVTLVPLITYNAAALRLNLSTLGFMQYITPTMTAVMAVWLYGEELSSYKLVSLIMIWTGILIVSIDGFKKVKD